MVAHRIGSPVSDDRRGRNPDTEHSVCTCPTSPGPAGRRAWPRIWPAVAAAAEEQDSPSSASWTTSGRSATSGRRSTRCSRRTRPSASWRARTRAIELLAWVTAVVYREPGPVGQDGHHPRCALRGPGVARHRRRLERGRITRASACSSRRLAERFERLEEALQICLQMWSDDDGPTRASTTSSSGRSTRPSRSPVRTRRS